MISYNEEGILDRSAFERVLAGHEMEIVEVAYKRFRSDSDSKRRQYRVLADRKRDEVREWLVYAHKSNVAKRLRGVVGRAG